MSLRKIAEITLPPTELVEEGSWGERTVGKHNSTMTLYKDSVETAEIEWHIESLDQVENIGLTFDNKVLTDYDGIMSLPQEAIDFLRAQGYTVPAEFES